VRYGLPASVADFSLPDGPAVVVSLLPGAAPIGGSTDRSRFARTLHTDVALDPGKSVTKFDKRL
jgi:hypothetical protein